MQGTDITEAFEVHHLNYEKVKRILEDHWVRDAKHPRNFVFTFKQTGFYSKLRSRVAEKLKTINTTREIMISKVRSSVVF